MTPHAWLQTAHDLHTRQQPFALVTVLRVAAPTSAKAGDKAVVTADGRGLFLEIPDIRPASQIHLAVEVAPESIHDLFLTAHALDASYAAPGVAPRVAPVPATPLAVDLARALRRERNPFQKTIAGAREVEVTVGPNLSFSPRVLRVRAGEPLAVTLVNPDSVPHNWALVRPGSLGRNPAG